MKKLIIAILAAVVVGLLGMAPASAAAARNVTCDGVLAAGTYNNVFVAEGADCYVGPEVTIEGNFFARQSPGTINVNTDIGHNFMVANATGSVTFGPEGCKVDPHVGNNLMIRDSANVAVCEATVDNNIVLSGNTGRLMLRDSVGCNNIRVVNNEIVRVKGNVYGVNLTVTGNDRWVQRVAPNNTKFAGNPQQCRKSIAPAA
ncbi:MAG: hypothetical protein WKF76_06840 [Nocardioidaceae bacterium]